MIFEALVPLQYWILRILLLLLLVGAVLARDAAKTWIRGVSPRTWWMLGAIVAGGAAARAFGSAWSVYYENAHAFHELERVGPGKLGFSAYGLGVPVLWQSLFLALPGSFQTVFAFHFVLSSLCPLLVFVFARGLYGSDRAALLCAALLAFHPVNVLLAATDSQFIPQLFFLSLGLAALELSVAGKGSDRALALAFVSLVYAAQCRPAGIFYALPAGAFLLLRGGGLRALWRRPGFRLGLGIVAVSMPIHAWGILRLSVEGGQQVAFRDARILYGLFSSHSNPLLDGDVTPWFLLPLAVISVISLARIDRRALWVVVPPVIILAWFNAGFAHWPVARLRYNLEPLFFCALLAGGAALSPWLARLSARGREVVFGLLLLLPASGLVSNRQVLSLRYDAQLEWTFLRNTIPTLPTSGTLVFRDRRARGGTIETSLPWIWFTTLGKRYEFVESSDWVDHPLRRVDGAAIWYRGISCWHWDPREVPPVGAGAPQRFADPRMRPQCRELEDRYALEPIAETTFTSRSDGKSTSALPRITLGFYRIGARLPGAAPVARQASTD